MSAKSVMAPLAQETTALVEFLRRSLVQIKTRNGQGAGVIWSRDGLIITNAHVATQPRVWVELSEGETFWGDVIARDKNNDLAAVRVTAPNLIPAVIGDSRQMRVGELVLAVGHPLGVSGAASLGIVSAKGDQTWMGRASRAVLQADVDLAPGNSGGPLADSEGRVVGINSMVVSPGIAIAIPTHVVQAFVAALPKGGK